MNNWRSFAAHLPGKLHIAAWRRSKKVFHERHTATFRRVRRPARRRVACGDSPAACCAELSEFPPSSVAPARMILLSICMSYLRRLRFPTRSQCPMAPQALCQRNGAGAVDFIAGNESVVPPMTLVVFTRFGKETAPRLSPPPGVCDGNTPKLGAGGTAEGPPGRPDSPTTQRVSTATA